MHSSIGPEAVRAIPEIQPAEFRARRAVAAERAAELGLAALVVWSTGSPPAGHYGDVYYLTNFVGGGARMPDTESWQAGGRSAVVLDAEGRSTLLTANPVSIHTGTTVDDVRQAWRLPTAVGEVLAERGLDRERVGLVGRESLLYAHYAQLARSAPGVTFVPADEILRQMRLVKSDQELEYVRYAGRVGAAWMKAAMDASAPGVTEGEIVGEALRVLAAAGGYPADIAIASGPYAAELRGAQEAPNWDVTRRLEPGDMVKCDFWGPVQGYFTDLGRSTVVGADPTPDQLTAMEGAIGLVEALVDAARPGRTMGDLYEMGLSWLVDQGLLPDTGASADLMFPCFGHSIGITIEQPHIVRGNETVLAPNIVLAVEGFVTVGDAGMGGFEQNVIITDAQPELLTGDCPTRPWA